MKSLLQKILVMCDDPVKASLILGSEVSHRHVNDDTKNKRGGWISSEAQVSKCSHVGPDSAVLGRAVVVTGYISRGGRISGNARIEESVVANARVGGNAIVQSKAQVYGGARVSGEARIIGPVQIYEETMEDGELKKGFSEELTSGIYMRVVDENAPILTGAEAERRLTIYGTTVIYKAARMPDDFVVDKLK